MRTPGARALLGGLLLAAALGGGCGGGARGEGDLGSLDAAPEVDAGPVTLPPQACEALAAQTLALTVLRPPLLAPHGATPMLVALRGPGAVWHEGVLTLGEARLPLIRGVAVPSFRSEAEAAAGVELCGTPLPGPSPLDLDAAVVPEALTTGQQTTWSGILKLASDFQIPAGAKVTLEPGTVLLLGPKTELLVEGELRALGTRQAPILVAPLEAVGGFGGIRHGGSVGQYQFVIFTGGGADSAKAFGHSKSQPVLMVRDSAVTVEDCLFADNPGKALGAEDATVTLRRSVLTRCDTGAEFVRSRVLVEDCHILQIPDGDGVAKDDDNDGLYFRSLPSGEGGEPPFSVVRGTVVWGTEDDCIDHNGAELLVEGCLLEGCRNEGLAASDSHRAELLESLVQGCGQGVEAGYGSPSLLVRRSTLRGNGVGARFGDSYDQEVGGTLTLEECVVAESLTAPVLNLVGLLEGPLEGAIRIKSSLVDSPEFDQVEGNLPGTPLLDLQGRLLPSSPGYQALPDQRSPGRPDETLFEK